MKKRIITLEERSLARRKKITVSSVDLHSSEHHSFIFGLSGDELFKMMTSMTAQHYFDTHGKYPSRLDRTKISIRNVRT